MARVADSTSLKFAFSFRDTEMLNRFFEKKFDILIFNITRGNNNLWIKITKSVARTSGENVIG